MKAIFKGYKMDDSFFNFTKGMKYQINDGYKCKFVIDDNGCRVSIDNSSVYDFEIVEDDDLFEEPASLKYYINGNLVQKSYFYELIGELNEADRLGAKVSSVKFEIKFE
ncbi:hypothetical protein Sd1_gp50 [Shigella phage Sd1]|uniref:Uncharacterized protein n=1 Tax=Shigella phage Sd1 TaxID=2024313 RepID=A0A291AYL1_9CAUD|nr:virion structural protein [Shigella phage Sd1]ATE86116.1 hypothetical protein Sd1_gp50 [Shigella phage Sd1]